MRKNANATKLNERIGFSRTLSLTEPKSLSNTHTHTHRPNKMNADEMAQRGSWCAIFLAHFGNHSNDGW